MQKQEIMFSYLCTKSRCEVRNKSLNHTRTSFCRAQHRPSSSKLYFVSLMVANALQSAGTVMSVKWVALGGVTSGPYCSAQGRNLLPYVKILLNLLKVV
jgi:hypothetical protein